MNQVQRNDLSLIEAELEVLSVNYIPSGMREGAMKILRDLKREELSMSAKTDEKIDRLIRRYDERLHNLYKTKGVWKK